MNALTARAGPTIALDARRVARNVAAPLADEIDRDGRPPVEAVLALREAGLLGAAVPRLLGGQGAGMQQMAAACYELGRGCSSTAMVFAMHQIQVASLVRHAAESPWHLGFLRRVGEEGLLLASGTTEGVTGGDVRRSGCAIGPMDGAVRLEKHGCVISYAGVADAVLITARRDAAAAGHDQVLLVAERGQLSLEQTQTWDTLGMRGTDSRGYSLIAQCDPAQVVPAPYGVISAETMLPVSHIVWASLWLGIATDACARARAAVRARRVPGTTPPGAARLAEAVARLQCLRAMLKDAVHRYEYAEAMGLGSISFGVAMNGLKISASTMAVEVAGLALQSVGIAGYRNGGPFSLGRHLRDLHSAMLMIGNDRIAANNAALMTAYRGEEELFP